MKKKVLVVGAGPAGLTAALKLCASGNFEVTLIESGTRPGGLSRSLELWGRQVDLGPHRFFSQHPEVNALWAQMAGDDVVTVQRKTSILFHNRLIDYPLSFRSVLTALNFPALLLAAGSYLSARLHPKKPENTFQDVIINRFGLYLFRIFFKNYTENVWGVKCSELDSAFALQRIKDFSIGAALSHILARFFKAGESRHKTLLSHFAYPRKGAGAVYCKMASEVIRLGGTILYNSPAEKLNFTGNSFSSVQLKNGTVLSADTCISTMPLTFLLKSSFAHEEQLLAQASEKLRFRNTILVYVRAEAGHLFDDQWIYINEKNLRIGRVTNFNNWVRRPARDTILCLEMWCDHDDELWRLTDGQLAAKAVAELQSIIYFKDLKISETSVVRLPNSYPVYMKGYRAVFDSVASLLSQYKNLICIGRAGGFRYNNQDHSILMGLLAFENTALEKNHDLWSVNLDSEYMEKAEWVPQDGNQVG